MSGIVLAGRKLDTVSRHQVISVENACNDETTDRITNPYYTENELSRKSRDIMRIRVRNDVWLLSILKLNTNDLT